MPYEDGQRGEHGLVEMNGARDVEAELGNNPIDVFSNQRTTPVTPISTVPQISAQYSAFSM